MSAIKVDGVFSSAFLLEYSVQTRPLVAYETTVFLHQVSHHSRSPVDAAGINAAANIKVAWNDTAVSIQRSAELWLQ